MRGAAPTTASHCERRLEYIAELTPEPCVAWSIGLVAGQAPAQVEVLAVGGLSPVTFGVDGVRFGCRLGMEIHKRTTNRS